MDGLQVALVAGAAFYAGRSLLGLMREHEAELRAKAEADAKAAAKAARKAAAKPASSAKRPAA